MYISFLLLQFCYLIDNKLTEKVNNSNIKVEGDNLLLEYQRYGRNKKTIINHTYINSGEYRNKFDKITKNIDVLSPHTRDFSRELGDTFSCNFHKHML